MRRGNLILSVHLLTCIISYKRLRIGDDNRVYSGLGNNQEKIVNFKVGKLDW